jgi:hypothetical protein
MFEENSEALLNEGYSQISELRNEDYSKGEEKLLERKVGRWTHEEDEILKEMVIKHRGKNWKKVAEHIKGRTSIQCLHRWSKILQPGLVKGPWTIEEDRKLMDWVRKEGPTKWSHCAEFISGRNGKQCRERWFNSLNPDVKKGDWTPEEDYTLFFYYKKLGGKWSQIQYFFESRSENAIKNRFYSTLRRHLTENKKLGGEDFNNNPNKLDELIKFLPIAEEEIKYSFMKKNNLTLEEIQDFENNLVENIELKNLKPASRKVRDIKFCTEKFIESSEHDSQKEKTKFSTENNANITHKLFDQKTINNFNINVNINSNQNNNFNFTDETQNLFNPDFNQYKALDIYTLEKDIAGMCDSNLFFNDNNNFTNFNCYNFDSQLDNILDNLFSSNNIVITNNQEKECKVCVVEDSKKGICKEIPPEKKENKIIASEVSQKSKPKKNEKNKEVFQNLLSQLNGLEKLVKNAKKELSKFEHNGDDMSGNTLENLFKYN